MKRLYFIGGAIVLVILIIYFTSSSGTTVEKDILISPSQGPFEVSVTTNGELQAKNSQEILGPVNLRKTGIYRLSITDLVPEGTVVEKGNYVAQLDKSELAGKIAEVKINLTKYQSQYEQAKLDCTLSLSQARDEMVNLFYSMEERKLEMEQSVYEAPATRRQAELEYEKSKRAYNQARENYQTKVQQATAKMREVEADLFIEEKKFKEFIDLEQEFTISAPENGMVIYARSWDGKKIVVGSMISAWNPVIATLPDLSIMESITHVNEVDIRKIKVGQEVIIGLDADPEKKLSGKVTHVANVGEQHPTSDSKVFEVKILVNEKDSTLRPAMSTSNTIIIETIPQALYLPLESIHSHDSLTYVYVKDGMKALKQEIRLGLINENEAIILEGLKPDANVYLNIPEAADKAEIRRL